MNIHGTMIYKWTQFSRKVISAECSSHVSVSAFQSLNVNYEIVNDSRRNIPYDKPKNVFLTFKEPWIRVSVLITGMGGGSEIIKHNNADINNSISLYTRQYLGISVIASVPRGSQLEENTPAITIELPLQFFYFVFYFTYRAFINKPRQYVQPSVQRPTFYFYYYYFLCDIICVYTIINSALIFFSHRNLTHKKTRKKNRKKTNNKTKITYIYIII